MQVMLFGIFFGAPGREAVHSRVPIVETIDATIFTSSASNDVVA